ncbi:MAG: hypothetical protein ACRDJ4_16575 [Actinomycetota bacterium]
MVLTFAQEELTAWTIALGIGLVVILVVIALLTLLLRIVQGIDVNVFGVWEMAKRVAANTATTWMLAKTDNVLQDVKDEAMLHDQLLSRAR